MPRRRGRPNDQSEVASESFDSLSAHELLRAILGLLIEERERQISSDHVVIRTELLLNRLGLPSNTISVLTGKNAAAVRMALSRARARSRTSHKKSQQREALGDLS